VLDCGVRPPSGTSAITRQNPARVGSHAVIRYRLENRPLGGRQRACQQAKIERNEAEITINADDDLKLKQMHELLQGHLARRKIDAGVIDYKTPEKAAGQAVRQKAIIRQGIDKELAKRLVKDIKGGKFKVQVAIQGDELRVTGKKRDDLQAVIEYVKGLPVEQPLQYVNFRD
jgi:uncharacterized protein YajQ (UPF0234 family)